MSCWQGLQEHKVDSTTPQQNCIEVPQSGFSAEVVSDSNKKMMFAKSNFFFFVEIPIEIKAQCHGKQRFSDYSSNLWPHHWHSHSYLCDAYSNVSVKLKKGLKGFKF